jgi:Zn-dependent protease with chaperone function
MDKAALNAIRLKEEVDLLAFFEKSLNLKAINNLMAFKERESPDNFLPFYMRGYYLPVSQEFGGRLYTLCHEVASTLGFEDGAIEFYVSNSADFNATSISSSQPDHAHVIIFNRALLEKVSEDQLRFVVGHEVGHIIFQHSYASRVIGFVYPDGSQVPPIMNKLYDLWSKLCEISCDRIGLIASGSIRSSVEALFRISSGLEEKYFDLTYDSLVQLAEHTFEEMKAHPSYLSISHPANPVRIKALLTFEQSAQYRQLAADGTAPADTALDLAMEEVIGILRRTPLNDQERTELRFLASAGLLLMGATESCNKDEYDYLINMLSQYIQWPPMYLQSLEKENLTDIMVAEAKTIMQKYPYRARDLLAALFPVIVRDRRIDDRELEFFVRVGTQELSITPSEVFDLLLNGIRAMYRPLA